MRQIFKGDFPFPPRRQHTGSVKGRMTNNNPAIGIMGIADMFWIGFVFSHGKSPWITHQQGQSGLSTVGAAHLLAARRLGWVCYSVASMLKLPLCLSASIYTTTFPDTFTSYLVVSILSSSKITLPSLSIISIDILPFSVIVSI